MFFRFLFQLRLVKPNKRIERERFPVKETFIILVKEIAPWFQ